MAGNMFYEPPPPQPGFAEMVQLALNQQMQDRKLAQQAQEHAMSLAERHDENMRRWEAHRSQLDVDREKLASLRVEREAKAAETTQKTEERQGMQAAAPDIAFAMADVGGYQRPDRRFDPSLSQPALEGNIDRIAGMDRTLRMTPERSPLELLGAGLMPREEDMTRGAMRGPLAGLRSPMSASEFAQPVYGPPDAPTLPPVYAAMENIASKQPGAVNPLLAMMMGERQRAQSTEALDAYRRGELGLGYAKLAKLAKKGGVNQMKEERAYIAADTRASAWASRRDSELAALRTKITNVEDESKILSGEKWIITKPGMNVAEVQEQLQRIREAQLNHVNALRLRNKHAKSINMPEMPLPGETVSAAPGGTLPSASQQAPSASQKAAAWLEARKAARK